MYPDGTSNPQAEVWLGMHDQIFWAAFNNVTSDTSASAILITPAEALTLPLPRKLDNTTVPQESVDFFVRRWNNSHTYWNLGYTTRAAVPANLDQNFFAHGGIKTET